MQTIYLDISNKGVMPTIYAKQGNVGQKIKVVLTNSGVAYPVPDGAALSVWYSGTSGEGNYSSVGEESAFGIDGNTVTVELITQMMTNAGGGALCLVVNDANGDQIGLWNLAYVVEAVPGMGSQAAEQYYTAFSEAVKNLPYPDASLTAPGKAADAAAVGEALKEKLSGTDVTLTAQGQAADAAAVGSALLQKLTAIEDTNHPGCYYRTVDGVAEWINPPMVVGVEYRTTERSNGNVVYAMRVNPGSMVASGTVPITISGATKVRVLRYFGQLDAQALPVNVYGTWVDVQALNLTTIQVRMHTDEHAMVGGDVFVDIWYTKD